MLADQACRKHTAVLQLYRLLFFFGHKPSSFLMTEKNKSFRSQCLKTYRLMNTVTVSFNSTTVQMTEMF